MEMFVIVAYCASDDAKKKLGIKDDVQTKVGMGQIMTTALVAAQFYGGNHKLAQEFLYEHKYFHHKLSKSQFNRRFHNIPNCFFDELVSYFSHYAKITNESFEFAIDSFPVAVCDNIRSKQSKLFRSKEYKGYIASKKRYFHGVRVHMITSMRRLTAEFKILPGSVSDMRGARDLEFALPNGSAVYADKGYSDYKHEDLLRTTKNIELLPIRKKNSLRTREQKEENIIRRRRKTIETAFSQITKLIPKAIHAVTQKGFIKKVFCFILAYNANFLQVTT
jgi:hypothetical protein